MGGGATRYMCFVGQSTLEILCSHKLAYHSRKPLLTALGIDDNNVWALNTSLALLTIVYSIIWLLLKRWKEQRNAKNA